MVKRKHSQTRTKSDNMKSDGKKAVDKRTLRANLLRLLVLIAVTLATYIVYNVFVEIYFYPIMISYMGITAVSVLAYVIYNRGFSRKGITAEMLPDTMSDEEKNNFINDAEIRLKKSRPLLIVAFAFSFTLIIDVLKLTVIPFFAEIFTR